MATKTKATTKPSPLKEVSRQPSPIEELLEQSEELGHMGIGQPANVHELLEEMIKALVPLRFLKVAAIDYQEKIDHFIVNGYLSMFLIRMDDLIYHAQGLAKRVDQKDHDAA
jgi:hypothetical protein